VEDPLAKQHRPCQHNATHGAAGRHCDSGTGAFTRHVLSLIDGEASKGNVFGVLGCTWNAGGGWQCPTGPNGEGGPLMIRGYTGTPTVMGAVLRNWMLSK
jgi:hypothetical protein